MLGNGRLEAKCIDGVECLCHICGQMQKKDAKADVILKYMPDKDRLLKAYGELPENIRLNEGIDSTRRMMLLVMITLSLRTRT